MAYIRVGRFSGLAGNVEAIQFTTLVNHLMANDIDNVLRDIVIHNQPPGLQDSDIPVLKSLYGNDPGVRNWLSTALQQARSGQLVNPPWPQAGPYSVPAPVQAAPAPAPAPAAPVEQVIAPTPSQPVSQSSIQMSMTVPAQATSQAATPTLQQVLTAASGAQSATRTTSAAPNPRMPTASNQASTLTDEQKLQQLVSDMETQGALDRAKNSSPGVIKDTSGKASDSIVNKLFKQTIFGLPAFIVVIIAVGLASVVYIKKNRN